MGYKPRDVTQAQAVHAIAFVERFLKRIESTDNLTNLHWARWDMRDINRALGTLDPFHEKHQPGVENEPLRPYPPDPVPDEPPIQKPGGVYGLRTC